MINDDEAAADLAEMIVEAEAQDIRNQAEQVITDFVDTTIIGLDALALAASRLVEALRPIAELAAEVEQHEDNALALLEDDFWSR